MNIADLKESINKFSFPQMVSNNDGKTSASACMGVLISTVGTIMLAYGGYEFHTSGKADIMMYASANILVGAGLLGYRKSQAGASVSDEADKLSKVEPIEETK